MGNCAVCDGTASKKDEFITNASVLEISNHAKGSTKDDNQLAPLEEHKNLDHGPKEPRMHMHIRESSLLYNQQQIEEVPSWDYRKDFPIFTLRDVIGCISTDHTSDYESETLIYTGEIYSLKRIELTHYLH